MLSSIITASLPPQPSRATPQSASAAPKRSLELEDQIFLDEIGELELALQPRLLRALERRQIKRVGESQHRAVDVRVIAATNRDLQRRVNRGTFRADLYYRLAVMPLLVPPLRARPDDVELLVEHLLPEVAARIGVDAPTLSPETLQQMIGHPWPGNVRELRNFLERLVTLSRSSAARFDPAAEFAIVPLRQRLSIDELAALPFKEAKTRWLAYFDTGYLTQLLARCDNNVAEAARQSGIDRVHLFRLIKKYGIQR